MKIAKQAEFNKNYIIWGVLFILIAWMASGFFLKSGDVEQNKTSGSYNNMVTRKLEAFNKPRIITLYGVTNKITTSLKTALSGRVKQIFATEGAELKKGEPILLIEKADLPKRLEEAEMRVEKETINLSSAKKLLEKKLTSEKDYHQARENMASALAQLAKVREEITFAEVNAPYDGVLESIDVEVGDFIEDFQKMPLGVFSYKDVLRVTAGISEKYANDLDSIQKSTVKFLDGTQVEARIHYINKISSPDTKTFNAEFEMDLPIAKKVSGETVEIELELPNILMYRVPISAVVLDEEGILGVKIIEENKVKFHEIEMISDDEAGIWVAGLPEKIEIIESGAQMIPNGYMVR